MEDYNDADDVGYASPNDEEEEVYDQKASHNQRAAAAGDDEDDDDVSGYYARKPGAICLGDFMESPDLKPLSLDGDNDRHGHKNAHSHSHIHNHKEPEGEQGARRTKAQVKLAKLILSPKVEIVAKPVFDFKSLPMGRFILS